MEDYVAGDVEKFLRAEYPGLFQWTDATRILCSITFWLNVDYKQTIRRWIEKDEIREIQNVTEIKNHSEIWLVKIVFRPTEKGEAVFDGC